MIRRLLGHCCMLAMLVLGLALPHEAQSAELQVPFDAAGRITRVDEPLARRLSMFIHEHEGFREARLFMVDDSSFVLEITLVRGGQSLRERTPLSREQADALRADLAARLSDSKPLAEAGSQASRVWMLSGSAALGFGFYGWAVPYILDVQDGSQAFGAYLLTSGTSFFLPLMLTADSPVSASAANLYWYGASRGIAHGVLLADAFDDQSSGNRGVIGMAMTLSVVEGVAGYAYATSAKLDPGTTQAIAMGGDFGLLWGYNLSDLASTPDQRGTSAQSATMLAGSFVGMAGGRALASRRAYSYGDGVVMRTAGYAGGLVGIAFADAAAQNGSDSKAYSAGLLIGTLAGLGIGDRLVAGREFTAGDGMLVQLGTGLGALMGLGVVSIVNPRGGDTSTPYWAGTATGGVLGYAMTYSGLSRRAVARASEGTSWRMEIAPAGLLAALGRLPARDDAHRDRGTPVLARVSCRF